MTYDTALGNFMFILFVLHIYTGYTHLEYYIDALHHLNIVDKQYS